MRKVLGILILVLFLGTVFAGLAQAQGYGEQGTAIKSESGMPDEIKPYIIVKRTAEDQNECELNKWGGNAVQNDKYGIDLVVRAAWYDYHPHGFDSLVLNATVIAAGDVYKISETTIPTQGGTLVEKEYLKMKSLELGASKDYLPNEILDTDSNIEITSKEEVATHNLTTEERKDVVWLKKIRPVAENVSGIVASTVAGFGSEATGPLAPFVSLGAGEGAKMATHMLFKEMERHIINDPAFNKDLDYHEKGYVYAKGVLRKEWNNKSAGLSIPLEIKFGDDPKGSYQNHIITIRARLVYDVVMESYMLVNGHPQGVTYSWEAKEKSIETYVSIHIVADDSSGRGEATSSSGYAVEGNFDIYSSNQWSFENREYITGVDSTKESTEDSPVEGVGGWEEYRTLHQEEYQLATARHIYYQGIITGSDSKDYYEFSFDPGVVPHSTMYDSYRIKVELVAGRGAPMKMDIDYRWLHYSGYTTKGRGKVTFEIWSPAWKTGQTQGKVMKIKVYPDKVYAMVNGNKIAVNSKGVYLLSFSVGGYRVGNYQPYVHITDINTYGNHASIGFHIEDKKGGDWDNGLIYKYTVYWGDGTHTTVTHVDKTSVEKMLDHLYSNTGSYNIKVVVEDYYSYSYGNSIDQEGTTILVNGGNIPTCPTVYTYNGEWREENNVLVWAENATRPFLNTEDNYLFEANEINGSVILGIGEPGEDVDFVDAIKLYRVYAPPGYEVAESYTGMIYAYRDVEGGIAKDNHGRDVTSLISGEDDNYWVGDKGDYVDITLNLSRENLLVIRGIDNPPQPGKLGKTVSTIWLYANISGEWVKLGEIKVRHSMHTNVINLDALSWFFGDKVELRFEMRDRNGIDFIGVAHDYRVASVERVPLIEASYGYENISARDGNYLRINPGDFVRLNFEGKGDGLYLLKVYGFYFNREMIGRGIGIASADEVNIAEAKLQESIEPGKYYVLLPLLENYSGICHIEWYVDSHYMLGDKPLVRFDSGEHLVELYIYRWDGSVEYYQLQIYAS